jgi:hypothetical protein
MLSTTPPPFDGITADDIWDFPIGALNKRPNNRVDHAAGSIREYENIIDAPGGQNLALSAWNDGPNRP